MTSEPDGPKPQVVADAVVEAKPEASARPTVFPASMAFGITLLLWGIVTSPVVLSAGALVIVASLIGWIGEIGNER
jgi:hypothetical protein